jgi:ribosome-binding factor A
MANLVEQVRREDEKRRIDAGQEPDRKPKVDLDEEE